MKYHSRPEYKVYELLRLDILKKMIDMYQSLELFVIQKVRFKQFLAAQKVCDWKTIG